MNDKCSTAHPSIKSTSSDITLTNRLDHLTARLGVRREQHLIEHGLYVLGKPTKESPVFVSANYTLSFDALRSALNGNDCYILVLDTKGINDWSVFGIEVPKQTRFSGILHVNLLFYLTNLAAKFCISLSP